MRLAFATPKRALISAVCASALFAGCGAQRVERRGGADIPDLNGGSASSSAGSSGSPTLELGGGGLIPESGAAGIAESEGGAAGAVVPAGPVPWCDAYKVINCVCQQCHQDPTLNGAAMPLLSYANTQAGYPRPTSSPVWKRMQTDVTSNFMPYMGDPTVTPPVKPLTAQQKNTLLTWLMEGAHDEGGLDCPTTCDWSDGTPEL